MNQLTEWQIIVLAENLKSSPASDLIATDLKNLLRTFCFIPPNNAVNIQFCLYTDFDLNEIFFDKPSGKVQSNEDGPRFSVLRIQRGEQEALPQEMPDLVGNQTSKVCLVKLHAIATSSPWTEENLSSAFTICRKVVNASRTMLVTFGHGDGFAVFGSGQPANPTAGSKNMGQSLNMDDLAAAIRRGFPGRKIDLILLQNCFMMTTDTLFALQHVAEYVVAPQTAICFYGYHYKAILESILSTSGCISGETLCQIAVTSVSACPAYSKHDGWLQKLALFGVHLKQLHAFDFFALQNELFALFLGNVSKETLLRVRRQIVSPVFTASFLLSSGLIDLYAFLSLLETEINQSAYTAYLKQYKLVLSAMFGGENPRIFKGSSLQKIPAMQVNGMNIFIPLTPIHVSKGYYQRYYLNTPSAFARQSRLAQLVDYMNS